MSCTTLLLAAAEAGCRFLCRRASDIESEGDATHTPDSGTGLGSEKLKFVGLLVGCADGWSLGDSDGSRLGDDDGCADGCELGSLVGGGTTQMLSSNTASDNGAQAEAHQLPRRSN